MTYTISITSQGQLSIPALIRKQLGFDSGQKAILRVEDSKVVIERIPDVMELAGIFKTNKRISGRKIRKDFEKYLAQRHLGRKLA